MAAKGFEQQYGYSKLFKGSELEYNITSFVSLIKVPSS